MPENWTAIFPPICKKNVDSMVARCEGIIDRFTDKILNHQKVYYPWWLLPIIIALIPISLLYLFLGRFFLAKLFFFSTKCNGCGICKNKCPVKAIKMIGNRPYWTIKCESCQRCLNFCPNKAIQTSLVFMIIAFLLYNQLFKAWIEPKIETILSDFFGSLAGFVMFILWNILALLVWCIAYILMITVARIRWVNILLTYTSITNYYGRYREPSTKVQDFED